MYNRKPNLPKPLTQNSFTKIQRQYPQSKNLITSNENKNQIQQQITIDNTDLHRQLVITNDINHKIIQPGIINSFQGIKKYHFITTQYMNKQDLTLIYQLNLPNNVIKSQKRKIVIKDLQYILTSWTQYNFPSVIYLVIPQIAGFLNQKNSTTSRVAALQLSQLHPIYDQSHIKNFDLKYKQRGQQKWEIQNSVTTLSFKLTQDDQNQYIQCPLPQPLVISFQIIGQ